MRFLLFLLFLFPLWTAAQEITVLEVAAVPAGKINEAVFYYTNNWAKYRDSALKAGYIVSYSLQQSIPDTNGTIQLVLMTGYRDEQQLAKSEVHFSGILRTLRPDGPVFLNTLKPAAFRTIILSTVLHTLFADKGELKQPDNPGHLE